MTTASDRFDRLDEGDIFTVDVGRDADGPIVSVGGEFDLSAADSVRACIDQVRRSGRQLVIDLSATTFIDSSGIKVLLEAYRSHGRNHEAVVLRRPSDVVQRTLAMTALDGVFRIDDGVRAPSG
jgi:anti-sigma B factor antagonist